MYIYIYWYTCCHKTDKYRHTHRHTTSQMFFRIVALSQLQLHGWLPSMQFRLWKLSKHRLLPSIWLQSYTLRQQTMGSIDPIHTCQPWRPGSCGKDVAGRADLGRKVPYCWRCGMMWNKKKVVQTVGEEGWKTHILCDIHQQNKATFQFCNFWWLEKRHTRAEFKFCRNSLRYLHFWFECWCKGQGL